MGIFKKIKDSGEIKLVIKKRIAMGIGEEADILEFVNRLHLDIEERVIYLAAGAIITAKIAPNGWPQIIFENGDSCDVAFDEEYEYDLHFEIF